METNPAVPDYTARSIRKWMELSTNPTTGSSFTLSTACLVLKSTVLKNTCYFVIPVVSGWMKLALSRYPCARR